MERTNGRFIIEPGVVSSSVFENQIYAGAEVNYNFENKNDITYPTLGLDINLTAGYKTSIDNAVSYTHLTLPTIPLV